MRRAEAVRPERCTDSLVPDDRHCRSPSGLHREFALAATNDGLAAARARGKTGGRPPRLTPEQIEQAQELYDSGTPVPKIARTFKAAPATIYRYITPKTAN
ncbi:Hin recombinase [Streptomyces lunaelactis]|uniref:helix-turn-helix domain-containing protein n=1 Tax=Streptomyces lunaelactis TaxID=1535768 RepID=UPI001584BD2B|nr:helix-turn-helix domain-containing protein [Streptomyces lunaelactis]NUL05891.1 Hin recombinase [Streptomyces lunaelactis]